MFQKIKKTVLFFHNACRLAVRKVKAVSFLYYNYALLREPKVKYRVPHDSKIENAIKKDLINNNFTVVDFEIDVADYRKYIDASGYKKFRNYFKGGKADYFAEKSLEHYLAAKLLNLSEKDIYIDVANANSPAPEIYHHLYGCNIYRQDLSFPEGINGNVIGGDASKMPVEDGFATKMALHCSFEHFEQDSDIRFIKEAARVLIKGGKLCIVPLYLFNKYAIQTDPAVLPKGGISFEPDAVLYCAKGWGSRHGRFYDIPHLVNRIKNNLSDLQLIIYFVKNEKEIDPTCYVKFIALFEKE